MLATTKVKQELYATVRRADGRIYNLGRVDNKKWAPRAWWYRFALFPIDKLRLRFDNKSKH